MKSYVHFEVSLCENQEKSHYFQYFAKNSYTHLYVLDDKIKPAMSYKANEHFLNHNKEYFYM